MLIIFLIELFLIPSVLTCIVYCHGTVVAGEFLETKVTFLGLILAGGTFQYSLYQTLTREMRNPFIHNLVGQTSEHTNALIEWRNTIPDFMVKQGIPYYISVLTTYLCMGASLIFSILIDFWMILSGTKTYFLSVLSIAFFANSILLLTFNFGQYIRALHSEFPKDLKWFRDAGDAVERSKKAKNTNPP